MGLRWVSEQQSSAAPRLPPVRPQRARLSPPPPRQHLWSSPRDPVPSAGLLRGPRALLWTGPCVPGVGVGWGVCRDAQSRMVRGPQAPLAVPEGSGQLSQRPALRVLASRWRGDGCFAGLVQELEAKHPNPPAWWWGQTCPMNDTHCYHYFQINVQWTAYYVCKDRRKPQCVSCFKTMLRPEMIHIHNCSLGAVGGSYCFFFF